jgi:hypothetical protein
MPITSSVGADQAGLEGRPAGSTRKAHSSVSSSEAPELALAFETFGEPEPLMLLRQEGALRILGWTLGSGRAESRDQAQRAEFIGIDVVLIGDGRYAISERMAADGVYGLSRLEARCEVFDTFVEARRYCEEAGGDSTRVAARLAALDHATRRWPPLRGHPGPTPASR